MTDQVETIAGRAALVMGPAGQALAAETLASDLISLAWEQGVDLIIIPASRLPEAFFSLKTGVLGEAAQKLVNYRVQMAVLGDVSNRTAASTAFRDYVYEANTGATLWFAADMETLQTRLKS